MTLNSANQWASQFVDGAHCGIVLVDTLGAVRYSNPCAQKMLGYCDAPEQACNWIQQFVLPDDQNAESERFQAFFTTGDLGGLAVDRQMLLIRADGERFWAECSCVSLQIENELLLGLQLRDTDSVHRRIKQLQQEARTDGLTGLANRRQFQSQLESNLERPLTLAILDIDRFKLLNDTYGHPVGDDTIKSLASLLAGHFPEALCLGRLGGDEFGILQDSHSEQARESHFERFLKLISENESHGGRITASLGVVRAQLAGHTARELLSTADRMLYQAKANGRNCIVGTEV